MEKKAKSTFFGTNLESQNTSTKSTLEIRNALNPIKQIFMKLEIILDLKTFDSVFKYHLKQN